MSSKTFEKDINNLLSKLDEKYPSDDTRNDGLNYWNKIKIIDVNKWNDMYWNNSFFDKKIKKHVVTSEKPFSYLPNDYVMDKPNFVVFHDLQEIANNWYSDYVNFMTSTKNPRYGKSKCRNCVLSGFLDDPIFNGIEKVFARIINNHCGFVDQYDKEDITMYPCLVMNIFQCPFNSDSEFKSKSKYTKEELFFWQRLAFAIELQISEINKVTKNNEQIYNIDFKSDKLQRISTDFEGIQHYSKWESNIEKQLEKVKPILDISIKNKNDLYDVLINKEKLEILLDFKDFEKNKEDLKQFKLIQQNKDKIIDFLMDNKDLIRINDLRVYDIIYQSFEQKKNCNVCNKLSNIICMNCNKVWLCKKHCKEHKINHLN